jgi:hypothetical protein
VLQSNVLFPLRQRLILACVVVVLLDVVVLQLVCCLVGCNHSQEVTHLPEKHMLDFQRQSTLSTRVHNSTNTKNVLGMCLERILDMRIMNLYISERLINMHDKRRGNSVNQKLVMLPEEEITTSEKP